MMFSMGCEFSTSMVDVSLSFEVPLDGGHRPAGTLGSKAASTPPRW